MPENPNSAFAITVDVDRPDRRYDLGDPLTLRIESERDCYVTIFDVGTSGKVTVLLPNRFRSDNHIKAKQQVSFPGPGDGFEYVINPPKGRERIVVVATTRKVDLAPEDLAHYANARAIFETVEAVNARTLMERVGQQLQEEGERGVGRDVGVAPAGDWDWASDQVTFRIGRRGDGRPKTWAFVAAVADYPGEDNDLTYPCDDARLFAKVVRERLKVPKDRIRSALNADATPRAIEGGIDWLARNAGANDRAYIFFSGHGITGPDDGDDEDDGVDEFLCFHGGNVRDDDFGQWVHRIKCAHIVTFIDACFSGGAGRGIKSMQRPSAGFARAPITDGFGPLEWRVRAREIAPEGFSILAASRPNQTSLEREDLSQGVFTHFLAKGLRGPADLDLDGAITLNELHRYTFREVTRYTGGAQQPFLLPKNANMRLMP